MVPRIHHIHWPDQDKVDEICGVVASRAGVPTESVRIVKSPYRICPLGAHVDHQGGLVSAMALDFGIVLVFVPTDDGTVRVTSDSFGGQVSFPVADPPPVRRQATPEEPCCWGNFPRGAAFALQRQGHVLRRGIDAHLWSPRGLDSGGISSSAAVGVAYLLALEAANGIEASKEENVELDRLIENEYLGLKNGILDQSAILMSRPGQLTVIDCAARRFSHVSPPWLQSTTPLDPSFASASICSASTSYPRAAASAAGAADAGAGAAAAAVVGPRAPPFKVLLAFSGVRAALAAGSSFNTRVTECHAAAQQLATHVAPAAAGAPGVASGAPGVAAGAPGVAAGAPGAPPIASATATAAATTPCAPAIDNTVALAAEAAATAGGTTLLLGHFTHEQYERHALDLGGTVHGRRAAHFFGETGRVADGVRAWAAGDLAAFGELMKASGRSSISNYEVGTDHLKVLQSLLHEQPGVYGARFSGAGTRGACVALVEPEAAEQVATAVHAAYVARFPDMDADAQVVLSDCGDGAHLVR